MLNCAKKTCVIRTHGIHGMMSRMEGPGLSVRPLLPVLAVFQRSACCGAAKPVTAAWPEMEPLEGRGLAGAGAKKRPKKHSANQTRPALQLQEFLNPPANPPMPSPYDLACSQALCVPVRQLSPPPFCLDGAEHAIPGPPARDDRQFQG